MDLKAKLFVDLVTIEQELGHDSTPFTETMYSLKFMGIWKHSTPNSEN
jgi:hypothetical protein